MITVTAQGKKKKKKKNRLWQVCLSEHFWLRFILMHKRSQQKQVCKTKHPSGIYSPGFLSNTLSSSIRGGKKNQFCHLSFFVLKKKNVCGIIHQHPATELSSASPGYVLDCYGSHANIFLIFVPNTHICIIPMQPVYLQLLHQTYLE